MHCALAGRGWHFFDVAAVWSSHRTAASLLQGLLDLLVQLRKLERLVDVRICTVQRRRHLVQVLSDPGQHHHTSVSERDCFANASADFPTAHAWHHHVQDDQVGEVRVCETPRLVSVACLDHIKSLVAHVVGNQRASARFVICDQHNGSFRISHYSRSNLHRISDQQHYSGQVPFAFSRSDQFGHSRRPCLRPSVCRTLLTDGGELNTRCQARDVWQHAGARTLVCPRGKFAALSYGWMKAAEPADRSTRERGC